MGLYLRLLGLLVVICFNFSAQAKEGSDSTSLVPQDPEVTEYKEYLKVLEQSFELIDIEEAVDRVRRLPTTQSYEVIKQRLIDLPKVTENHEIPDLKKVLKELLGAFEVMGAPSDTTLLDTLVDWADEKIKDPKLVKTIKHTAAKLQSEGELNFKELFDIEFINEELIANNNIVRSKKPNSKISPKNRNILAHRKALKEVGDLYEDMRKTVIGQEEILRSLQTLYLKDLLRDGQRVKPEVFYFMGLPGNGKDTIVESYVDAMWNVKGSHEKHMFRMNIRTKEEAWSYFGSGKGYYGSSDMPSLLRWLVAHSGGKYLIFEEQDGNKTRKVVHKNPEWKPGSNNYAYGPHKAVIFINEAHNMPKDVKDNIIKQAMEKGIFPITNPGSDSMAVSEIVLPVTFVFATNEGIDLLEPRQRNGTRIGEPLSYEVIRDNWERVYANKPQLKEAILKNNGQVNDVSRPDMPGTSEEFLNRIPSHHTFLLEPQSPDDLVKVAKIRAAIMSKELEVAQGRLGQYEVVISEDMYQFLTSYKVIAAENSRPIEGRLSEFVFDPIYEALRTAKIRSRGVKQIIKVDVKSYENRAHSTVFEVIDSDTGEFYSFNRLMRTTLQDIPKSPISKERLSHLFSLRDRMIQNVFGVEHIAEQLAEAAVVAESESRNSGKSARPATVMAFLGKSSTGKTETAKQSVKARYGDSAEPIIIDFNGVKTIDALEAKIQGSFDYNKNPISSKFMQEYDRARGALTFVFDEAANAPKELLKALYEILREPVAFGFSDGKARPMKNVTIILTGNAGEQIYDMIPKNLPAPVYERALREVFNIFLRNDDLQHRIMLETFPEALLARLGKNIFHFGPLDDGSKRQITQLKMAQGLKTLLPKRSERGWDIQFESEADLLELFEMVELQGFNSREQGASIDKFIRESIIDKMKVNLIRNEVENGAHVSVRVSPDIFEKNENGLSFEYRQIILKLDNLNEIKFEVPVGLRRQKLLQPEVDQIFVAYHEVGHEVVSSVFMGDVISPSYLSIIEGVSLIGERMVHYAGVRAGEYERKYVENKSVTLRMAAQLAAGYVAQELISIGGRSDSGKSNDIGRITEMVQAAILKGGLSIRWGIRSIPTGVKLSDYVGGVLTDSEKELLSEITKDWIRTAETMAREALLVNFDKLFVNMSKELAEKGFLDKADIEKIYAENEVITERDGEVYEKVRDEIRVATNLADSLVEESDLDLIRQLNLAKFDLINGRSLFLKLAKNSPETIKFFGYQVDTAWEKFTVQQRLAVVTRLASHIKDNARDARLSSRYFEPPKVANIEAIIKADRDKATSKVTLVDQFQVKPLKTEVKRLGYSHMSCKAIFAK